MMFTQTVTFIRRGAVSGQDDMGEPIRGADTAVDVPAWYEPAGSAEDTTAAQQVVTGYMVYTPRYVYDEFNEADAVVLDFEPSEYEIEGEIARVPDGYITPGYCMARVEKVKG